MTSLQPGTIYELIEPWGADTPDAHAILAPGRTPVTFSQLIAQVRRAAEALASKGMAYDDRLGLALPAGPEMGVLHIAAVCAGVSVPLNPDATVPELTERISRLKLRCVIVPAETPDAPARLAATSVGVPVLEVVSSQDMPAGSFAIRGPTIGAPRRWSPPLPGSAAVVLSSSGTTARPKTAVQTHSNRAAAALRGVVASAITPQDRNLNIMPLFHTQGLHAELITPLAGGAGVVCAPGFDSTRFFDWLDEFRPTMFNAVPTMHQLLLQRAGAAAGVLRNSRLRLVRSSSAPLPASVRADMERTYGVRVIISYGATECSNMAQTPLPPAEDRTGSVGRLLHDQVWVCAPDGTPVGTGQTGEIVVGGPTVVAGYEGDPAATAESFVNGRFKSGDLGYIDGDGYLFIIGRIKEVINRGGEKISPVEIDEELLREPSIEQACAFAVPDPLLGEIVAAAVVLRPGHELDEAGVRSRLATQLGAAKTPSRIFPVNDLPKNVIGKVDRIRMATRLGITAESLQATPVARQTDGAKTSVYYELLASAWKDVLKVGAVSDTDTFIGLGGDSLLAARLLRLVKARTGLVVPVTDFFDAPTVPSQAAVLDKLRGDLDKRR